MTQPRDADEFQNSCDEQHGDNSQRRGYGSEWRCGSGNDLFKPTHMDKRRPDAYERVYGKSWLQSQSPHDDAAAVTVGKNNASSRRFLAISSLHKFEEVVGRFFTSRDCISSPPLERRVSHLGPEQHG